MYGSVEVIVFSKQYEKFGGRLANDQVLVILGRVSAREEEATKLVAQEFLFYEDIPSVAVGKKKTTFWIKVPKGSSVSPSKITATLSAHPGDTQVMVYNEEANKKILLGSEFWVTPCDALTQTLEDLLGGGTVKITGK
jgi:DNA polymerase-3 subunit alpha